MKLFVDTADLNEIRQAASLGVVAGVTTNPTLLAKNGAGDVKGVIQEICALIPSGPVSMECVTDTAADMIAEGREFATWAPNVCVKVPFGVEGMKAVSVLSQEGIQTNVTLVFSANQAILAAAAGATYISSFVGRLDDIGHDGLAIIEEIVQILANYNSESQVLAASIRHPLHVVQSAQVGAHVATIPFKVLMQMYAHPLTEKGIAAFTADWQSLKATAGVV
ncbi:MAG: fructose-6-phosphate aldolase [Candidatus Melainabacteria bacterium]|nr:fructose-6-phosphate aldolase [Candidatus Melainabacteria bacterium]